MPPPVIVEVDERRSLPPVQLKAREGELILGALPASVPFLALDERGVQWSSRALAERIGGEIPARSSQPTDDDQRRIGSSIQRKIEQSLA